MFALVDVLDPIDVVRGMIAVTTEEVNKRMHETDRHLHDALEEQGGVLNAVGVRLSENRQILKSNTSLLTVVRDRMEWFKQLGMDLKRSIYNLMAGQFAIFRELVAMRTMVQQIALRSLDEDMRYWLSHDGAAGRL